MKKILLALCLVFWMASFSHATYIPQDVQPSGNTVTIGTKSATIDITGLDLDRDGGYRIDFDLVISNIGSYPSIYGYINNDTTATNYNTVRAQMATGGQSFYTSNDSFMTACDPSSACKLTVYIMRDLLGKIWIWREGVGAAGGSAIFGDRAYVNYTPTLTNVTSFKIVGDQANCFTRVSSYKVFKFDAPIPSTYASITLPFDGSDESTTFTDTSIWDDKTWTAYGTAQLDTAQSKFGGASLKVDGASYISTASHPSMAIGTGDYTLRFFVRISSANTVNGNNIFLGKGTGNSYNHLLLWDSNANNLTLYYNDTDVFSASWTPSLNTWYYLMIQRVSGVVKVYVDNVEKISASYAGDISDANIFYIGAGSVGDTTGVIGWIDDFVLTKEVLSTAVPTSAYSD